VRSRFKSCSSRLPVDVLLLCVPGFYLSKLSKARLEEIGENCTAYLHFPKNETNIEEVGFPVKINLNWTKIP
jgi:hypothetical protein